jgi:hypothetical protein
MKVIIDRFEGKYAVLELPDKTKMMTDVLCVLLPGAKEGDVIDISIDAAATAERREHIAAKAGRL